MLIMLCNFFLNIISHKLFESREMSLSNAYGAKLVNLILKLFEQIENSALYFNNIKMSLTYNMILNIRILKQDILFDGLINTVTVSNTTKMFYIYASIVFLINSTWQSAEIYR
jgi:hypothetical protein